MGICDSLNNVSISIKTNYQKKIFQLGSSETPKTSDSAKPGTTAVTPQKATPAAKNLATANTLSSNNLNKNKAGMSPDEQRKRSRLLLEEKIKNYDSNLNKKKMNHSRVVSGPLPTNGRF